MLKTKEREILDNQYFIDLISKRTDIDRESIAGIINLLSLELFEILNSGQEIKILNCITMQVLDIPGQKILNKKKQLVQSSGFKILNVKIPRDMRRTYTKFLDFSKIIKDKTNNE